MKNTSAIIFLIATILMGLVTTGKVELGKIWTILLFAIQTISLISLTNQLDIKKSYKKLSSLILIIAFIIIAFLYLSR